MRMNPLRRKLVDHPRDWPWSSFSFSSDLKCGLIRVDRVQWFARTEENKTPLLRFQRLEPDEVRRETSLYAHEPGEEKPGHTSERLAVEQFFILCPKAGRFAAHRSHELIT